MPHTPQQYTERYVHETIECLKAPYVAEGISKVAERVVKARAEGRNIFFFGNGGSAATSSHMSQDLGKLTIVEGKPRFRTLSLTDPLPLILAWANDKSYSEIFAEQVKSHGRPGDIAIGISGSGNSPNVLRGLEEARKLGMTTIGLIGMGGGKMKPLCDIPIVVPSNNMQHIEDLHHILLHLLTSFLRDEHPA
ncbi:MAG: SIS domain-containing protein [Euryarchaeota archaeon]|nr:SIS domain-containing protein [Euryarchaeota archaeon]MDE1835813.1 SIS domain-containing protein [Euryarchaeota archaeon]MDE1880713.1 SIS domain-containing protein [Euryarchaeota archaeon]MDE2044004.1 SIS domain-containing protein [Thermoplasmata archaeon]